jgi:hypothetical protein
VIFLYDYLEWIENTMKSVARLLHLKTRPRYIVGNIKNMLAHGRGFSPDTPASSTTKTGRHEIAEILLKVALNTKNKKNLNQY